MLINLLIPKNLQPLFKGIDSEQQLFIENFLIDIKNKALNLKKKRFGKITFYSFNANNGNYYHRLIFEKVELNQKNYFVLKNIAWNHDYSKALTGTSCSKQELNLNNYISTEVDQYHIEMGSPTVWYNNCWYTLSSEQSQLVKSSKFPQLLIAPPGAGKTLYALAKLQEKALAYQSDETNHPLKMFYVTQNNVLKNSLAKQWEQWTKENAIVNTDVEFLNFKELLFKFTQTDALNLENTFDLLGKSKIASTEILAQELIINAHVFNADFFHNINFDESEYKKLGVDQSLIKATDRKEIFQLFHSYFLKLSSAKYQVNGLSPIQIQNELLQSSFTVVDEAQKVGICDLLNALYATKDQQTLFLGDSLQKAAIKISSLSLLSSFLFKKNIHLTTDYLYSTFRLPTGIASFANSIILLHNNLRQGLVDHTSYTAIKSQKTNADQSGTSIQYLEQWDANLGSLADDAHTGVLIFDDKDHTKVLNLIGSMNIFTVDQAQGLEFQNLIIYISNETLKLFFPVNMNMKKQAINEFSLLRERKNTPPQKGIIDDQSLEILSLFYIALTRAQSKIWIHIELNNDPILSHGLRFFLPWLKKQILESCSPNKINPQPTLEVDSSEIAWLNTINNFVKNAQFLQAEANLMKRFSFSKLAASSYVQNNLCINTVADLHEWRNRFDNDAKPKPISNINPNVIVPKPSLTPNITADLAANFNVNTLEAFLSSENSKSIIKDIHSNFYKILLINNNLQIFNNFIVNNPKFLSNLIVPAFNLKKNKSFSSLKANFDLLSVLKQFHSQFKDDEEVEQNFKALIWKSIKKNNLNVFTICVKLGADLTIKSSEGLTIAECLFRNNNEQFLKVLAEYNADENYFKIFTTYKDLSSSDNKLDYLNGIANSKPDSLQLRLWLASMYYEIKRYEQSLVELNSIIQSNPQCTIALLFQARIFKDLFNFSSSLNIAQSILDYDPTNIEASLLKLYLHCNLHEFGKMITECDRFLQSGCKHERIHFYKIFGLYQLEQIDARKFIELGLFKAIPKDTNALAVSMLLHLKFHFTSQFISALSEQMNKRDCHLVHYIFRAICNFKIYSQYKLLKMDNKILATSVAIEKDLKIANAMSTNADVFNITADFNLSKNNKEVAIKNFHLFCQRVIQNFLPDINKIQCSKKTDLARLTTLSKMAFFKTKEFGTEHQKMYPESPLSNNALDTIHEFLYRTESF